MTHVNIHTRLCYSQTLNTKTKQEIGEWQSQLSQPEILVTTLQQDEQFASPNQPKTPCPSQCVQARQAPSHKTPAWANANAKRAETITSPTQSRSQTSKPLSVPSPRPSAYPKRLELNKKPDQIRRLHQTLRTSAIRANERQMANASQTCFTVSSTPENN